jgi:hypothetical protein
LAAKFLLSRQKRASVRSAGPKTKAAIYSADNLMIVERDIGRLAKYTFDMGGPGDLLLLSLNVPPWEDLHELSREELRLTNLVTTDMIAQQGSSGAAFAEWTSKPARDHFVSSAVAIETNPAPAKSTKSVREFFDLALRAVWPLERLPPLKGAF